MANPYLKTTGGQRISPEDPNYQEFLKGGATPEAPVSPAPNVVPQNPNVNTGSPAFTSVDEAMGGMRNSNNDLGSLFTDLKNSINNQGLASSSLDDEIARMKRESDQRLQLRREQITRDAERVQEQLRETARASSGGQRARAAIGGGTGTSGLGTDVTGDTTTAAGVALIQRELGRSLSDLTKRKEEALLNADSEYAGQLDKSIRDFKDRQDELALRQIDLRMKTLGIGLQLSQEARAQRQDELSAKKTELDLMATRAKQLAMNLIDVDENGEVLVASNEEILRMAQQEGVDPNTLISEVNARIDAVNKLNREERKGALEEMKLQGDILNQGKTDDIKEYTFSKQQGYTGSFTDYMKEKKVQEVSLPNSYKEWELAGKPGTYADFLSGSGVSNTQAARDQALAIMAPNSTTTIKDVPVKQRFAVESELNKLKNQALQSGDIYGVIRASAGGKDASDTFKQSFEKALNVIDQIVNLKGTIEGESTGPIWGIVRSNNPYDTKAQQIKAQISAIVPNLARGVYGEIGVLTDNDINLYSKTLPSLKSTQEVSDAVLGITIRSVQRSIENKIKSQAGFGVDMSGIENVYREVKAKADELLGIDPSVIQAMSKQYGYSVEDITNLISGDGTNPGLGEEQTRAFLESQRQSFNPVGGDTNPASQKTGMRTDRHNNPTAFTTAIAEQAGLQEGVDYIAGDPFPDNKSMRTATILGDPIDTTIKVIDEIGFYTGSGKQRWTHTAIPKNQWNSMSKQQKIAVVKKMYEAEGGSGELLKNYA